MTWQLPQHEVPGRAQLSDALLYGRRERVFLVLVAFFVAASAMLPLLGVSRVYGVSFVPRLVGYEPPIALLVPLGMLAFPIALLALNLVGALYGAGRARALVFVGLAIWAGVLGLAYATDHVPAFDNSTTAAFPTALAFGAFAAVTCIVQVELFTRMRGIVRYLLPIVFSIGAGGAIAMLIAPLDLGLAIGAASYLLASMWIGSLLLAPITRALTSYLRFGRDATTWVDDEPGQARREPVFASRRSSPDAWNSAEMAFFADGEQQVAELS